MTVGELYRTLYKCETVKLVQGDTTYFKGKANDIPLLYMDTSIKYIAADYGYEGNNAPQLSVFITIVLCE